MTGKLYGSDGKLVYKGEILYGKPYGQGTVYWPDGHIRQQGIFDIKGLVRGRICFENGQTRFEGELAICHGYGPNYPVEGKLYDEKGILIFNGKFDISFGGVGYPTVRKPREFGPCGVIAHIGIEVFGWDDECRAYLDAGQTPPANIKESRRQIHERLLKENPMIDLIDSKRIKITDPEETSRSYHNQN